MRRIGDEEQVLPTLDRILKALAVLVAAGLAAAVGEDLWTLMKMLVDALF